MPVTNLIHGHTRGRWSNLPPSPEYIAWSAMKSRCCNQRNRRFADYGGRGITVFRDWMVSFQAFLAYMGYKPSPQHELDRFPNKDGNYEPGNVRWATPKEQCRNRRNNRVLTFQGESLTMIEWAERRGINRRTIAYRLGKGWSVERALTQPVRPY